MTIIMALAEFERGMTVELIKNNIHARSLRGPSNAGHTFLGYDKDQQNSERLIVNEKEAVIVHEFFNFYLELGSMTFHRFPLG